MNSQYFTSCYHFEHIIDANFHGEFDKALFQELVADDILDPVINANNLCK